VPRELAESYPLGAELPDRRDRAMYEAAVEGIRRLVAANPDSEFTVFHRGWPAEVLGGIPEGVRVELLGTNRS
jgi:7-cyano-7-deazaguanine tRNA-ribosyltransferase